MASVVCPHCDAKIRLARKKKSSSTEQPVGDSQTNEKPRESEQTQKKPPRLRVSGTVVPETKAADGSDTGLQADDSANSDISRRGQQDNDGLQIGDLEKSETADFVSERESVSSSENSSSEGSLPEASSPKGSLPVGDKIASADQAKPQSRPSESELNEESELADDLLPPKFLVPDIERDQNAVVLPAVGGGFQVVDKTEVRVMHEGRAVKLVSLSPEELKRVRLIENLVALLIAGIMLAVAAWLVL